MPVYSIGGLCVSACFSNHFLLVKCSEKGIGKCPNVSHHPSLGDSSSPDMAVLVICSTHPQGHQSPCPTHPNPDISPQEANNRDSPLRWVANLAASLLLTQSMALQRLGGDGSNGAAQWMLPSGNERSSGAFHAGNGGCWDYHELWIGSFPHSLRLAPVN